MTMAAKLGDRVLAVDTHIVMLPSPAGPIATPMPAPFDGQLVESLCTHVLVDNKPIAIEGSVAFNTVPHTPAGGPFQTPPSNRATVKMGCETVLAGGRKVARALDPVETCNDPMGAPRGVIIASSTVKLG